jgi:hypothetical protein
LGRRSGFLLLNSQDYKLHEIAMQVGTTLGTQRLLLIGAGQIIEEVTGIDNDKMTLCAL